MTVPAAPTSFTATSEPFSIDLAWDPVSGATGYNVFLSTASGTESPTCLSLSTSVATCADVITDFATCANLFAARHNGSLITGTTYTVTGLTNGTTYYLTVVAVNSTGPSFPSAQASSTPALQAPGRPAAPTASAANAQATITWNFPSDGGSPITGFTVTSSHGDTHSVGPTVTTYTMTGLTNFAPYTFTVHATNAIGTGPESPPSGIVTPEASPGRPSITAVPQYDANGVPGILLTVIADTTAATGDAMLFATILRVDGSYVIGASPLDPLPVPLSDPTVLITDYQAPYGVSSSYVAAITFTSTGPPVTTPPSIPATAVMAEAPDTLILYNRLGWATDEDESGQLLTWLSGIGQMLQETDSLTFDGWDLEGTMAPGWSRGLDIERAPTNVLPWLGQFVGVTVDSSLRDDQQRYEIQNPTGFARGTPSAIIAAANKYLAPGFTATLNERDSSPYHLTITIPTVGFKGNSTCLSLMQQYPTCNSLITSFSTCAELWSTTPSGSPSGATTCLSLSLSIATCADVITTYATCADVWETDFFIGVALAKAIPAGIVTTVSYV